MRKTFLLPVAAATPAGPPPDNIEHSVRFNSADNAYLSRTPSSAGNRKTWTWSGWVKRSNLKNGTSTGQGQLFNAYDGSNLTPAGYIDLRFDAADKLVFGTGTSVYRITTQVFKDPSAWYHLVVAVDTTQATANDRIKFYVNGGQVTDFSTTTNPSQNEDLAVNGPFTHRLGAETQTYPESLDGYLANIHFVDGNQKAASDFGFTDSNGVWQPIAYSGSYGTNGFHLDFADTSSATALGNDVSGNNNDFTPSGLVAGPAYTANSWSTEFDGSGDYLDVASSADFNFGTGEFTVECWYYSPTASAGSNQEVMHTNTTAASNQLTLRVKNNLFLPFFNGGSPLLNSGAYVNNNQWHHLAVTRDSGGTARAFVDGVQRASADWSTVNITNSGSAGAPRIGFGVDGKISNLRAIKGQALYTAAFTPPTVALTTTSQGATASNVKLLTCQDSTIIDNSPSAHTITANGDAATSTVSPFEPVDGSDAMLDSPTNYGSGDLVRGNYCTLNPLTATSVFTLTNGNLDVSDSGSSAPVLMGTVGVNSGKWYWELTLGNVYAYAGAAQVTSTGSVSFLGNATGQFVYNVNSPSSSWINGSSYNYSTASGAAAGDVIGVALNFDSNEITFYKNGVSQGVFGSNVLGTSTWTPAFKSNVSTSTTFNFGQQPFKYPAPAGYKSLCSTNLPTPAVADGSTAMDVALWTGNNSTQTISGLKFSPDLVWIKSRSSGAGHQLYDVLRGTTNVLDSSNTQSEQTITNGLTAFNADGFTIGNNGGINGTGLSVASWAWDAGSSTVSNTDGTITSQQRVNPSAGFSISTFTTPSSTATNFTVGHGLGAEPGMMIFKSRGTGEWYVWHKSFSNLSQDYLQLQATTAKNSSATIWNNTAPTSSVTSCGGGFWSYGLDVVGYCWAPVEGFSAFGTYTGNASADGPFVYTGFKPRWILIKNPSNTETWNIYDSTRGTYNVVNMFLQAHSTAAEGTNHAWDILSNGFKLRLPSNGGGNTSGATYIYAAFAEHPFKTSRAR